MELIRTTTEKAEVFNSSTGNFPVRLMRTEDVDLQACQYLITEKLGHPIDSSYISVWGKHVLVFVENIEEKKIFEELTEH
jgi:hypothetical protein